MKRNKSIGNLKQFLNEKKAEFSRSPSKLPPGHDRQGYGDEDDDFRDPVKPGPNAKEMARRWKEKFGGKKKEAKKKKVEEGITFKQFCESSGGDRRLQRKADRLSKKGGDNPKDPHHAELKKIEARIKRRTDDAVTRIGKRRKKRGGSGHKIPPSGGKQSDSDAAQDAKVRAGLYDVQDRN